MNKKIYIGILFSSMLLAACGDGGTSGADTEIFGMFKPTTTIGSQVWMAENLNVATEGSWCYDNVPANCKKYGRLYTWEAAQRVCPDGWHLPSMEEFEILLAEVGSSDEVRGGNLRVSSWNGGTDAYGFSALPVGIYGIYGREEFAGLGGITIFWSSNLYAEMRIYDFGAEVGESDISMGYSVRCLKD